MISMPASFDSASDRVRNLSHRRNDVNSNLADKKQYELDTDRILRGEDVRTTLMIKNIPNKYVNDPKNILSISASFFYLLSFNYLTVFSSYESLLCLNSIVNLY